MVRLTRLVAFLLLAAHLAAVADVAYVEEVVNSGVGSKKRGARRTVQAVQIKGAHQRVSTDIEASKDMIRTLQKQGVALQGTKILLLDQGRLYDIDRDKGVYRQQPLPASKPAAAPATAAAPAPAGAAKPAAVATEDADRSIAVQTKVYPDTLRVAGVLCHRVAAQITATHYKPGTKTTARVNRYLYQAWMADGFPGYDEIVAFRRQQEQKTSLAPLIRGGLEQLADVVEEPERLETELAALKGFPMQSELKVFSAVGSKKEAQVLQLSRRVLQLSHEALSDTLFRPSRDLKPIP